MLPMKTSNLKLKQLFANIVLLGLFILLTILANWQYNRSKYKTKLLSDLNFNLAQRAINTTMLQTLDPKVNRGRFITVSGNYLDKVILLDNYVQDKQAMYRALRPLIIENEELVILVDAGLIKKTIPTKHQLSAINTTVSHTIYAYIDLPIDRMLLGVNVDTIEWPLIMQNLDYALVAKLLEKPVAKFIISEQKPNLTHINASRHVGYALQWSTLALVVLVYAIIMNLKGFKVAR